MAEVTVCLFPESKPDSYNGLYRKTSELPKALEQIKTAVEQGELDTQIATASVTLRKGFNK